MCEQYKEYMQLVLRLPSHRRLRRWLCSLEIRSELFTDKAVAFRGDDPCRVGLSGNGP